MTILQTSEEWQKQSSLLLQARPTTTRITTKYHVPNLDSPKYQKSKKRKSAGEVEEKDGEAPAPKIARAWLEFKTYDPASGACLKFKTDRAAEVGRLINGLGRLGKHMAALPQKTEDAVGEDPNTQASATTAEAAAPAVVSQQASTGGGTGKKKKKGKK